MGLSHPVASVIMIPVPITSSMARVTNTEVTLVFGTHALGRSRRADTATTISVLIGIMLTVGLATSTNPTWADITLAVA